MTIAQRVGLGVWLPHLLLLGCHRNSQVRQEGLGLIELAGRNAILVWEWGPGTCHAPPLPCHGGVAGTLLYSSSPAQSGISAVHTQLALYLTGLRTTGNGTWGRVRG